MNDIDTNNINLPKEILDSLVLYLKDEIINFYLSEEGQALYANWLNENNSSSNFNKNKIDTNAEI